MKNDGDETNISHFTWSHTTDQWQSGEQTWYHCTGTRNQYTRTCDDVETSLRLLRLTLVVRTLTLERIRNPEIELRVSFVAPPRRAIASIASHRHNISSLFAQLAQIHDRLVSFSISYPKDKS